MKHSYNNCNLLIVWRLLCYEGQQVYRLVGRRPDFDPPEQEECSSDHLCENGEGDCKRSGDEGCGSGLGKILIFSSSNLKCLL